MPVCTYVCVCVRNEKLNLSHTHTHTHTHTYTYTWQLRHIRKNLYITVYLLLTPCCSSFNTGNRYFDCSILLYLTRHHRSEGYTWETCNYIIRRRDGSCLKPRVLLLPASNCMFTIRLSSPSFSPQPSPPHETVFSINSSNPSEFLQIEVSIFTGTGSTLKSAVPAVPAVPAHFLQRQHCPGTGARNT